MGSSVTWRSEEWWSSFLSTRFFGARWIALPWSPWSVRCLLLFGVARSTPAALYHCYTFCLF